MRAFRPTLVPWVRELPEREVYRLDPNGPKPRKVFGLIWNSTIVVFYGFLFSVPTVAMLMWSGGRTQLSREELLNSPTAKARMAAASDPDLDKEKRDQMNAVLFQTKASMKTDWAEKRDRERAQEGKQA